MRRRIGSAEVARGYDSPMSEEKKPRGKMTNFTYPERIPVYDTAEGKRIWKAIAHKRKCSIAAAVRQIAREEAERARIPYHDEEGDA